jgi:hypothetical protein
MPKKPETPNADIDKAIKTMMRKLESEDPNAGVPPDVAVKIINTAIAWEKVKHHIRDDPDNFNPDDM